MPPREARDAIVIALDVGKSVSQLNYWEDKTFFQQSRDCVSWIIQRKIISQSNDVLNIMLIGTNESNNKMAISGYENISCKFEFQLPSWDMLKYIEKEVKTTENDSDWLGALIVSIEMLKVYEEYNNVGSKKIVFFSDFTHPASDNLDIIVKSIKALDIQITIIGPDYIPFLVENEGDDDDEPEIKRRKTESVKSQERQKGEELVCELWKKLPENIVICNFESALKQLCSYTRKPSRITPWNCILDIGDIRINISMLKKTDPNSAKKFETKYIKPPEDELNPSTSSQSSSVPSSSEAVKTVRDKVMHYKHDTGDGNEILDVEVKAEDTIEGYRYGTTIIPFSEEDKTVMEYKSGPKSFSVIGFTNIRSVPYYLLSGECSYIVVPKDKDENAEVALSAIIQAMKKMECLAIVRRVYSENRGLSLGMLYPIIEEIVCDETDEVTQKEYLLFVELAFKEEVKSVSFPSLENVAKDITKKQYEIVDSLIDGMNLMKADKGLRGELCEAFDLSNLHDFKEQFFQYCVIQRGLHPEVPLPTSAPPHIQGFIRQPKVVEQNCKSIVEELKKHFKIELVNEVSNAGKRKRKEKVNENANTSNASKPSEENKGKELKHFSESSLKEEKNDSTREWMTLFSQGFPSDSELKDFLVKCVDVHKFEESEILDSFLQVLKAVRKQYMKINPDVFNLWMTKLKHQLNVESGIEPELWGVIVLENMGLISEKENQYSDVSEDEAEEFLCTDASKSVSCRTPKDKKPDFKQPPEVLNDLEAEMADQSLF